MLPRLACSGCMKPLQCCDLKWKCGMKTNMGECMFLSGPSLLGESTILALEPADQRQLESWFDKHFDVLFLLVEQTVVAFVDKSV